LGADDSALDVDGFLQKGAVLAMAFGSHYYGVRRGSLLVFCSMGI
jgi:hypothetical protein